MILPSGEVALWRAVIDRAIQDAAGHVSSDGPSTSRRRAEIEGEAQAFILDRRYTDWFELICDRADVDPSRVRLQAMKLIFERETVVAPEPSARAPQPRPSLRQGARGRPAARPCAPTAPQMPQSAPARP